MSAPLTESNTRALVIFTSYLAINVSLTVLVLYSIVRAYVTSAQARRWITTTPQNRSRVLIFVLFTCTSLAVTWQFMIEFFVLSYRSWKIANGSPIFISLLPNVLSPWLGDDVHLGPWLKDVKLFREAWETVVETPARTVWSMPIFFFTTGWSFFIMKEAVRRKIRHGWAYMVLGQLVAISFALNLFYLAVLVHPTVGESGPAATIADDKSHKDKKEVMAKQKSDPTLWTPPRDILAVLRSATFCSIFLTVTSAGHRLFLLYLAVPHLLLLIPPVLRSVLSRSSSKPGVVQSTESAYNDFYREQIKTVFFVGLIFETVALVFAWDISAPDRHLHRHSNAYAYPWTAELVAGRETTFQNLWRSLLDHPAVTSVGSDSILCTLSVLVWRATSL